MSEASYCAGRKVLLELDRMLVPETRQRTVEPLLFWLEFMQATSGHALEEERVGVRTLKMEALGRTKD